MIRRAGLPIAYFSFEPSLPYAYEIIYFYDNSIDLDGSIVTWIWDFGDGNKSYERNTSHFYADNGIYGVNLTVIDNDGNCANLEKERKELKRCSLDNMHMVFLLLFGISEF